MEHFDYIIVGAGSAGCVLADRLSACGRARVLLLESGPMDRSPWIHLPVGYGKLFYHPRLNYGYRSEPQPGLQGRRDYWPRGHVVGGSGAINAMVYCRGLPQDYDDWQSAGATGWGWQTALRTFERIETQVARDGSQEGTGPLVVSDVRDRIHPVNSHYFDALAESQLPLTDNINGPSPEGGTAYRLNTHRGRRWSSAQAFLRPALRRRNLDLRTRAPVRRVLVSEGRARGVEITWRGRTSVVHAGTVILSAGAVNSPKLLQLSGIGPGAVLAEMGIEVRVDNPNVGGNLQDHLGVDYFFQATQPTLNTTLGPWLGKLRAALQYLLWRSGPLSLSVNQCGGFLRSSEALSTADQQLYFNPVTYTTVTRGTRRVIHPDPFPGFILGVQPCRPTSRGRIDIASPDPAEAPCIRPNALDTQADQDSVVAGGRLCARILQAPAMRGLIRAPLSDDPRAMDDVAILDDFRARATSVFHPVATCRMGRDARTSVTDPQLNVHGVDGLRVVDASAFPNLTSGNTNAPTMMLAHRAADLILNTG